MNPLNLKQLQTFVQVIDLGSFRGAAERLNTTQPNISARIKNLETQLGVTLMDRDAGAVQLTPQGRKLLVKARQVLAASDDFIAAAEDDALFEGVLRLGVTETIIHSWLGRYVHALNTRFPNVDVELTVDLSDGLTAALKSRTIDLAIQSGPFAEEMTGRVKLGEFPLVWVAAPGHFPTGVALTLDQLTSKPVMTSARGTEPFRQVNSHLPNARLVPSTNLGACLKMSEEGLAISCVPRVMAARGILEGRLEELNYPWAPDPLSFTARYDLGSSPSYVQAAADVALEVSADPKCDPKK